MDKVTLIVTCSFGLEAVVKHELKGLGIFETRGSDGRVEFEATLADIPRLNIHLRVADRVLVKMAEFPADDFGQLFDGTKFVPWEEWLVPDAKITVDGKSVRSQLESVRTCQSIVKKAIIDRLMNRFKVSVLPETGAEFVIQVSLYKDTALLTLDSSGDGLHKRGYRVGKGDVPLRENLAAALVLLSGWDPAFALVDPMCGSGTILIEAAMIARAIPPGLNRSFASETWSVLKPELWESARVQARSRIYPPGDLKITGFDIDQERVYDGKANAKKAGVGEDIVFECRDVRELKLDGPCGDIISNPPYGIKLGNVNELKDLYSGLDRALRDKKGWSLYLITSDQRFPASIRCRKPDKLRKLFNGTIEANYYQYYGKPYLPNATKEC